MTHYRWKSIGGQVKATNAIRDDGSLWGWGHSQEGRLGAVIPTNPLRSPVRIGARHDWVMVASCQYRAFAALAADGTLWFSGSDSDGRGGNGAYPPVTIYPSLTQIGSDTDWALVAAGSNRFHAIKTDGTLWGWGFGFLGVGDTAGRSVPTQIGSSTDWVSVALAADSGYGLRANGTLYAWGYGGYSAIGDGSTTTRASPVALSGTWRAVAGLWRSALAIKADGTLWSWGSNPAGELGQGTTGGTSASPVQIGVADDWVAVGSAYNDSASRGSAYAINASGELYAWGDNSSGQLGLGDTTDRSVPTRVGSRSDWVELSSTNSYRMIAIDSQGRAWATGQNTSGELGLGDSTNRSVFTLIGDADPAPVAGAVVQAEYWTGLRCDGGVRQGAAWVFQAQRQQRLTGEDSLVFSVLRDSRVAAQAHVGGVIRLVEMATGRGTVADNWQAAEWVITSIDRSDESEAVQVTCSSVLSRLNSIPIEYVDPDGWVSLEPAAVLLPPATVISDYILGGAPAWLSVGDVEPTAPCEVPFSQDTALSGLRRLEERVPGYEVSCEPVHADPLRDLFTGYRVNYTVRGSAAAPIYLRRAKNIRGVQQKGRSSQVTRLIRITGAQGDYGPATLAYAYWRIAATRTISAGSSYGVTLAAIHGGPGPIGWNDQLNHAGLPGGANSLGLESTQGTVRTIIGSDAASQEVVISAPNLTGFSSGSWVRVTRANGHDLTQLDVPDAVAQYGVQPGTFTSEWDDTLNLIPNATMAAGRWSGFSTPVDSTDWITAGRAATISGAALPTPTTVYLPSRRRWFSATAWVRLTAGLSDPMTFALNDTSTGASVTLDVLGPIGPWQELRIEGYQSSLDSLLTLTFLGGAGGSVRVDSASLTPSFTARPIIEGSAAARIWQDANQYLADVSEPQTTTTVDIADMHALGLPSHVPVVLGGVAVLRHPYFADVTARVLEIRDVPGDPASRRFTVSTVAPRLTREPTKPLALVVPFHESLQVRTAKRDATQAATVLTASISASDDTTVTIDLDYESATGGGTPDVTTYDWGTTLLSGSGLGPYVYERPAPGDGVGRAGFSARSPGRPEAYDAVDIPEQPAGSVAPDLTVRQTASDIGWVEYEARVGGPASYDLSLILDGTSGVGSVTGALSANYNGPIALTETIRIYRADASAAPATAVFRAEASGGGASTEQLISIQPGTPPVLNVSKLETTATQVIVTYTYDGTLSAILDDGSPITPGASPWAIDRPASVADPIQAVMRCARSGVVVERSFTVPPKIPAILTDPRLYGVSVGTSGSYNLDVSWSVDNEPGSPTYETSGTLSLFEWSSGTTYLWSIPPVSGASPRSIYLGDALSWTSKGAGGWFEANISLTIRLLSSGVEVARTSSNLTAYAVPTGSPPAA